MIISGELDWNLFFSEYWRKQPLVVRGGARSIVGLALERDRFLARAEAVEAIDPAAVIRGGNGVVFVQNIDCADPVLAKIAASLGRAHGWYRPWFDAVLTERGSSGGIGCHYDDSDNFVLQQHGKKLWRVHSPEIIPAEERRQRMMKVPGIGSASMPQVCFETILEPGDLLYIPILYPHWGSSDEYSLSLSLVCNSTNASRLMAHFARSLLSSSPEGWSALPRIRSEGEAAALFEQFWEILTDTPAREQMRSLWLEALVPRPGDGVEPGGDR